MVSLELTCRRCGWRTVSGRDDSIARLRRLGMLRREPDPDDSVVAELLVQTASRMTCPHCQERGLAAAAAPASERHDDAHWQAAVLCEVCRQAVSLERLKAIPGTTRCAACQAGAESGQHLDDKPEFCPRCGALVEIRVSRGGGITRYRRFCTGTPPCRL